MFSVFIFIFILFYDSAMKVYVLWKEQRMESLVQNGENSFPFGCYKISMRNEEDDVMSGAFPWKFF